MKIHSLTVRPYEIALTVGSIRSGLLINVSDEKGNDAWGDIVPLPGRSEETTEDSLRQFERKRGEIIAADWTIQNVCKKIVGLELFPSVSFGLESALLSILDPLPEHSVRVSALLMGSPDEILRQASLRVNEGYTSAKLKVGHLDFDEAEHVIRRLKDRLRLRIDVNRAWSTASSLRFFSRFSSDAFDYVEEPFRNPDDLHLFPHPLAIDESFPGDLSLERLESLPTLKALVYKPTLQGGLSVCFPLHRRLIEKGVSLVLSASFESDLGLAHIASMARRLSLSDPVGIGTIHYLNKFLCADPLKFSGGFVTVPACLRPILPFIEMSSRGI